MSIHEGSLYEYSTGSFCGVLIKENVMRKLVRLQSDHLREVQRLLMNEADKDNVFPAMWTLHYPAGEQTIVNFIDISTDVYSSIKNAVHPHQPRHLPLVFIASSMEEAQLMADKRLE